MPTVRVEVTPKLFRWARERARLSAAALESAFPKLAEWERGEEQPTLRQLENFARRTHAPIGYFFLAEPPEETLPIPDFRGAKGDNAPHGLCSLTIGTSVETGTPHNYESVRSVEFDPARFPPIITSASPGSFFLMECCFR